MLKYHFASTNKLKSLRFAQVKDKMDDDDDDDG